MTLWARVREPRGRYCWQPSLGEGALLSLELGPPHLEVAQARRGGEPCREVSVRGTWQLVLHECAFALCTGDSELSERAGLAELEAAAQVLEGQALLEVIDEAPVTRFVFDLGGELRVEPVPELGPGALQWVLDRRGERAVGRRADGVLVLV